MSFKELEVEFKEILKNRSGIKEMNDFQKNNALALTILAVLIVGIFFTIKNKVPTYRPSQIELNQQSQLNNSNPWQQLPTQPTNPNPNQKIEELQKQYELLSEVATKIWERTKWNSDRITLLATINNHNLVVMQQGLPRTEIILLNEDWTINRLPDRIKLDPENEEFIKKFVRK